MCIVFLTFFQKFLSPHCCISLFCPQKVTPVFDFFEEILPCGNKKLITGSDTTQSSRTGIFTLASIVINNARQRLVQRNEPQHTRWQISLRIKLRPDKLGKVCRFYYKKYSKKLILRLTLSLGLIYYKQSLYLPTTTMAKKWKHRIKNFGNF